jgi:hypothetical protein
MLKAASHLTESGFFMVPELVEG